MRNNKFKVAYVVLPALAPLDDNTYPYLGFIVHPGTVYSNN